MSTFDINSPIHPMNSLGFFCEIDKNGIIEIRASTIRTVFDVKNKKGLKLLLRDRIATALILADKIIDGLEK